MICAGLLFLIPGCALIYYVIRCLKSGVVEGGSKYGGRGKDSRKENPTGYWGMIVFYAASGIGLLYLGGYGIFVDLKRHGFFH